MRLHSYFSDEHATDAVTKAESDPEAAIEALRIAADYLNRGEPLPGILASHLANAIAVAMEKPPKLRAKALTDELYLSAVNRRPKASYILIGEAVAARIGQGVSKDKALLDISEEFDISKETARRYLNQYTNASLKIQSDFDKSTQKPPTF